MILARFVPIIIYILNHTFNFLVIIRYHTPGTHHIPIGPNHDKVDY